MSIQNKLADEKQQLFIEITQEEALKRAQDGKEVNIFFHNISQTNNYILVSFEKLLSLCRYL